MNVDIKMSCKYQKIRSRKYTKYIYCSYPSRRKEVSWDICSNCSLKEYKKSQPIKGHKHKRTQNTDISQSVKEKVWERDNHKCIFCHKWVPVEFACCHEIRRSQRWTSE